MNPETYNSLIDEAAAALNPHLVEERLFGDVAAALISGTGHHYRGVSVDTPGWGLCAERSAIAAMITAGQYRILQIVAVWRDARTGRLHVLPPCGICREFMRRIDSSNLDTDIVLSPSSAAPLRDLLPLHDWPEPLEESAS